MQLVYLTLINGQIILIENQQETVALHDALDFMDLIDISKAFHPKAAEYAFFSSAQDRPDIRPQKSEYIEKIGIISSILSNYSGMKLEINYRKKTGTNTYMRRLNNMLLNNQREIKTGS